MLIQKKEIDMFYCNECAKKEGLPCSISKSGQCEICKENRICNEVPSDVLPDHSGKNCGCPPKNHSGCYHQDIF